MLRGYKHHFREQVHNISSRRSTVAALVNVRTCNRLIGRWFGIGELRNERSSAECSSAGAAAGVFGAVAVAVAESRHFFHVAQEVVEVLVHLFILGGILIEESVV